MSSLHTEEKPDEQAQTSGKRFHWHLNRYDGFIIPVIIFAMTGMAIAFYQPKLPLLEWPFILSIICLLLGLILLSERKSVLQASLLMLALVGGLIWYQTLAFTTNTPHNITQFAPSETVAIEGEVLNYQSDKKQYTIAVTHADGKLANGNILVKGLKPKNTNISGYLIAFQGNLYTPFSSGVPGSFDAVSYYKTQEVSALVNHAHQLNIISSEPVGLRGQINYWLGDIRGRITSIVHQYMPSPHGEVLGGLVLGRHAIPVDKDTKNNFINTGLIHLLAASGLNVGIVAAFIYWLAQQARFTPTLRIVLAMAGVFVYALLTGLPPSIMRATAMLEIALLLKLFKKELSPLSLLCLASGILLAVKPVLIGNIGFQMSFLSTFGIIAMVPYSQNLLGPYITRFLAGLILVPAVAQLWVLPISLYHFNQFPLHSLLLNILAVAVVAPLTILGFSIGMLSLLWQPLGVLFQWLTTPLVSILLFIVNIGSQWQNMLIAVASPPVIVIIFSYTALFLAGITLNRLYQTRDAEIIPSSFFDLAHNFFNRLTLKKSLAMLLVLTVFISSYNMVNTQKTALTEVTIIPLSNKNTAVLLKPSSTQDYLTLLPDTLTYWESRTLLDYIRHHNINTISSVALWQENGNANTMETPSDGLENFLDHIGIEHSVTALKTIDKHHTLNWGNLTVRTTKNPKQWFTVSGQKFCINAGHQLRQFNTQSSCAINLFKPQGSSSPVRIFDHLGHALEPAGNDSVYRWNL